MGHRFDIAGYISALVGKPRIKLNSRDMQFLFQLIESPEWLYSMNSSMNRVHSVDLHDDGKVTTVRFTKGPLSKNAVRKELVKLEKNCLIEPLTKESALPRQKRFRVKQKRSIPYQVTEYGLFCMLSQIMEYPTSLITRHWRSKVISTLLSPYFERGTFKHATPELHMAQVLFVHGSCVLTLKTLDAIEQSKPELSRLVQENGNKLRDELDWHAKSFALRLLIDTGNKDKVRAGKSRRILDQLLGDRKFASLLEDAVQRAHTGYQWLARQKTRS